MNREQYGEYAYWCYGVNGWEHAASNAYIFSLSVN